MLPEKEIIDSQRAKFMNILVKEKKSLQHPVFPGGHPSKY